MRRTQRRTLSLLVGTQVIGGVGVAIGITVGSLLAADLGGTDAVAGLAGSASVIGAALLAVPIAGLAARRGRRAGLALGYLAGAVGGGLVVLSALIGSLTVLLVGAVLFGGGTAANLHARYAATDLAPAHRRATSLSVVVWATTVGAVAGPNLAGPAGSLGARFGVPELAGPFGFSAAAFAAGAVVLMLAMRPDPLLLARKLAEPSDAVSERVRSSTLAAVRLVRAQPAALLGLAAAAVGHAVMVGVMAMTPVHLAHGGATLAVVGVVLSVHIAGMYALSPIAGLAADRFGRRAVILAGCLLLLLAVTVAGTAPETGTVRLGVGLLLLGLGWSATMVAGSTLLSESVPVERRAAAQGLSDLTMGLAGAAAGGLSGIVVQVAGYPILGLIGGIAVLPLAAAALRWRPAAPAPTEAERAEETARVVTRGTG